MKKSLLLFAVLICGTSIFSQNPYTKNEILELTYHNYKTSDFGITNPKNLVEISQKKYDIDFDGINLELSNTNKLNLKKDKITKRYSKSKYYTSESDYLYDKKYKTLQKRVYTTSEGEEVAFLFDKKNRMTKLTTSFRKTGVSSVKHLDYNDKAKTIEKYTFYKSTNKQKIIIFNTDKNGNIISKVKTSKLGTDTVNENTTYTYKDNNISSISKNKTIDGNLKKDSQVKSNFKYNAKNLIIEDIGDLTKSDYKQKHHYIYEYVYDKYGNWIAKYKFKTRFGYEDLFYENYKGIRSIVLRELTYKKETTGTTDIQATKVQNYLENVVANNPFKTKKAPKDGVYWEKTQDRSMKLYSNGKYITKNCNLLTILKNDFYVNDSVHNKMYILKDFVLKPKNKAFYKAKLFASNDELVWGKNKVEEFYIYKNGRIDPSKLIVTGFTQHQFIYDVDHNISYLLEDFSTKEVDVFYKVKPLKGNAFFFKTKTGNFGIIVNGRQVEGLNPKYAENGIDVILKAKIGNTTYLLKNYKNIAYLTLGEVIIQN